MAADCLGTVWVFPLRFLVMKHLSGRTYVAVEVAVAIWNFALLLCKSQGFIWSVPSAFGLQEVDL